MKAGTEAPFDIFESDIPKEVAANTYYVHQPFLSFHSPPRTLRHGATKTSPTICLIKNSWLWRSWKLQFGKRLADHDVVDPRGVVNLIHDAPKKEFGEKGVKGYKVRSWRLWCESGKAYHHKINAHMNWLSKASTISPPSMQSNSDKKHIIDEVIHFKWQSPFSTKTRQYQFTYAGIEFSWKGTGTVKESRTCGFMLHFNHLKLIARVPLNGSFGELKSLEAPQHENAAAPFRDFCLGKYTSSLGNHKAGMLDLYDPAIHRLLISYILPNNDSNIWVDVKRTRLYDIIVSTAICMIVGEQQKRKTLRKILEIAASEGGGNAGSN
jgi:hypothetical protein